MKKIFNKKTYGYLALFSFFLLFFYSQKSFIIDELFVMEENIKNIQTDIKIAEKRIATTTAKIEEIKAKNAQNIKEKVDIEEVKRKIKKQLKAYNLINSTVKVNLNSLVEEEKYLDTFMAEFELISAGASSLEVAKTLDFLGIYGVVESYKGNKVVVYVDISEQKKASIKVVQTVPIATPTPTILKQNQIQRKIEKKEPKEQPKKLVESKKDKIIEMKTDTIIKEPKLEQSKNTGKLVEVQYPRLAKINHDYLENDFSKTFLNAPKNSYTINLFSSPSYKATLSLLEQTNVAQNSFVFSFGADKKLYKVMLGVYADKQTADEIISKLPVELQKFKPRAERIYIKQNLFHKYHTKDNTKTNQTIKGLL